jgi:hypothetical protein
MIGERRRLTRKRVNPSTYVGGAIWLYVSEKHVKIIRSLEGWAPAPARLDSDPDPGLRSRLATGYRGKAGCVGCRGQRWKAGDYRVRP